MKKLSCFHELFFIFIFIFMVTIQMCSCENLIESTCKSSADSNPNINYWFCATSLQAAPASRCASSKGIGMIAIRLIRYNVTDTRCLIKQLLKSKQASEYERQCLIDCFELYSDAISTVKQAMKYYIARRYDDANIQISAIMEAATTCEEGFKERAGVVSPLTKRNHNAFQLSAVALSIMRMLDQMGSGRF